MDIINAILLGAIQGMTEWLPISSSGHLALAGRVIGDVPVFFNIMLHVGTTIVLLVYFRADIRKLVGAVRDTMRDVSGGMPFGEASMETPERRMAWLVVAATLPTVLFGYIINALFLGTFYGNPRAMGLAFIFTGLLLTATRKTEGAVGAASGLELDLSRRLTPRNALVIGTVQSLALLPGISRSGTTISTALFCGMDVRTAGRFSFLLAIPAVLGAMLLYLPEAGEAVGGGQLGPILAGTVTSMVVGYISLEMVLRVLWKGKIHLFAPYCFIIGVIAILFL